MRKRRWLRVALHVRKLIFTVKETQPSSVRDSLQRWIDFARRDATVVPMTDTECLGQEMMERMFCNDESPIAVETIEVEHEADGSKTIHITPRKYDGRPFA